MNTTTELNPVQVRSRLYIKPVVSEHADLARVTRGSTNGEKVEEGVYLVWGNVPYDDDSSAK
jgi:hypothetical protein